MISVHFQGKPFNITVIQVYAPTSNTEEAEDERFYEDLQPSRTNTQKRYPFHYRDWNAKVGCQEIPGVKGKFGLGVQNEAVQRLREFLRECTCHSKDPLPTTQDIDITRWSIQISD